MSLSATISLSLPPCPQPTSLLIFNSAWNAVGHWVRGRCLCVLLFTYVNVRRKRASWLLCLCIPFLSWGKLQSLKVLPSSCECSPGGPEVTEAEDQILFMIPFPADLFEASIKMCFALAFDLDAGNAGSWISFWQETDMTTDMRRQQTRDKDRKTSDRREKERREIYQHAGRKTCLKTSGTFEVCIFHSLSKFWC